jgi:O-antigen/teichoic acid export membrane protein
VRLDWRDLVGGTQRLFRDVWYMGVSDFTWACLWYSPTLVVGWAGTGGTEQVAWVGAAVRIVLAAHTFVFLYFFNLLPNLAKELSVDIDGWRRLMQRSIATSMWPACLIAIGGTLIAPVFIPAVYGVAFNAAIVPFQIAIWMIPVAWFSGHFRFSLIAAGQQRWEFAVSAATALVTVSAGVFLSHHHGSAGAASALLLGGVVNAVLAIVASHRHVGRVAVVQSTGPALVASALALAAGAAVIALAGFIAGTIAACLLYVAIAARQDNELVRLLRGWTGR